MFSFTNLQLLYCIVAIKEPFNPCCQKEKIDYYLFDWSVCMLLKFLMNLRVNIKTIRSAKIQGFFFPRLGYYFVFVHAKYA